VCGAVGGKLRRVRLLVGTSGYSYAPWKGTFYPEKLPAAKMLAYYAERLPAVEINNTFYRMPTAELLGRWAAETPEGFCFALKSTRRITHERRLADAEEPVRRFYETAAALGGKRGPTLFQLPPNARKDLPRLDAFLALLDTVSEPRAAFEFRHPSWLSDDVYSALRAHGAALCIAESEELETPLEATAGWGYLRLRRQDYDDAAVGRWAERLQALAARWDAAFVFFKHEDEGRGPALAAQLRTLLGAPASAV
jgi:uncharacterized protein YecE (DUF72 family)